MAMGIGPLDTHQAKKTHWAKNNQVASRAEKKDILVGLALPSITSPGKPSWISQARLEANSGLPQPLWFPNIMLIWSVQFHSFIQQASVEHSMFQAKCWE